MFEAISNNRVEIFTASSYVVGVDGETTITVIVNGDDSSKKVCSRSPHHAWEGSLPESITAGLFSD
jgi:hypothetical protein